MRYTTNETITIFRRKKSTNINRVIDKYNLNDNFYNSHINICNYFCMKKTKKIILTLVIILIIVGIIILLFLKKSKKKVKPFKMSFKQSVNYTNINGYYLPKDNLTNSVFIKCSVDNCKKCYGNSYNNTCISCFDSYSPIRNENNEIISCIYKPKNDGSDNATLNQSNILNYSNNISENKIESTSETTLINITEIKSELITNMNQNNITENKIDSRRRNNYK